MNPIDMFLALLDRYGPQTAVMLVVVGVVVRLVLWGMHFTDRLYDTNRQRSQSQNTIDEGQMKLTLTMANQADEAHKRLARLQDDMVEEQRRNQETINRLTDRFTSAALSIDKYVRQLESLLIRVDDWDNRFGLYITLQKGHSEDIAFIRTSVVTILTHITPSIPKDTPS